MENNKIIYLSIPDKYYNVYQKLLNALADFGKQIIDECHTTKSTSVISVVNCWNLFQSALACFELGNTEKCDFFINYINKQLDIIYKNNKVINLPADGGIYPSNKFATRIYVGSINSENFDFDINKLTEYVKEDTINGKYIVNTKEGDYIWILVPTIYENAYFTVNSVQIDTIKVKDVMLQINNSNIEYSCYRTIDYLASAKIVIEITNI